MVRVRGVTCALFDHMVQGPGVHITEPAHIEFIRKRIKGFRPENKVCKKCKKLIQHIYEYKKARALRMRMNRKLETISSLSASDLDDYDKIVNQSPCNPSTKEFVKSGFQLRSLQDTTSTIGNYRQDESDSGNTQTLPNVEVSSMPSAMPSSNSTMSSLDQAPTTSAAAAAAEAARRQKRRRALDGMTAPTATAKRISAADDVTVDDDYMPSPNATNGTRLPHIQPIPKRRAFVHPHPVAFDIYMQGTSGG